MNMDEYHHCRQAMADLSGNVNDQELEDDELLQEEEKWMEFAKCGKPIKGDGSSCTDPNCDGAVKVETF